MLAPWKESYNKPRKRIKKQRHPESTLQVKPKRNTLRHTLIKLTEIKHKERILKPARERQQVTYCGKPI